MHRVGSLPGSFSLGLLVACGPAAPAVETDDTGIGSTGTGALTTTPTTGPSEPTPDLPRQIACGSVCAETRVHDGTLEITPTTDVASLRCVERITGFVAIEGFDGPLPLELRALRAVDDALFINGNHAGLVDLAGLECLERVEMLTLDNNDGLVDISALAGLVSCPALWLGGNGMLSDASALSGVTDMEAMVVSFAGPLTVLPTLPAGTHLRKLWLNEVPELSDLTPLAGLHGSSVTIDSMPALTSIAPLAGWWIPDDPEASLGLARLKNLDSLAGLEGLRTLNGLSLYELPGLTSLEPLADLRSVDSMSLQGLRALPTLAGLTSLEEVGRLDIGYCVSAGVDELVDLNGLATVTSLGVLSVLGNANLQSLGGLDGLVNGPQVLVAADNPKLSQAAMTDFIAAHAVPDTTTCTAPGDCCGF